MRWPKRRKRAQPVPEEAKPVEEPLTPLPAKKYVETPLPPRETMPMPRKPEAPRPAMHRCGRCGEKYQDEESYRMSVCLSTGLKHSQPEHTAELKLRDGRLRGKVVRR